MARITKTTRRWFEMEGDEDGARVEIKALTPGEKADIGTAALDVRLVYSADSKALNTEQRMNPQAEMEMTAKLAVVGWENFFRADGKPLVCTKANILKAVREIDGFGRFVSMSLQKLNQDLADEAEEQEKNS